MDQIVRIVGDGHNFCLPAILTEYWTRELFTDVTFVFPYQPCDSTSDGSRSRLLVKAHSSVLAAASSFFRNILSSVSPKDDEYVILLPEFEEKTFVRALQYIYNGVILASLTKSELNDVMRLLENLQVQLPEKFFASKQQKRALNLSSEIGKSNDALRQTRASARIKRKRPAAKVQNARKISKETVKVPVPTEIVNEPSSPLDAASEHDWPVCIESNKSNNTAEQPEIARPVKSFGRKKTVKKLQVKLPCKLPSQRDNTSAIDYNSSAKKGDVNLDEPVVRDLTWFSLFVEKACTLRTCLPYCRPEEKITDTSFFERDVGVFQHVTTNEPSSSTVVDESEKSENVAEPERGSSTSLLSRSYSSSVGTVVLGHEPVHLVDVVDTDPEEADENRQDYKEAYKLLQKEQRSHYKLQRKLSLLIDEVNSSKVTARRILEQSALNQIDIRTDEENRKAEDMPATQKSSKDSSETVACEVCSKVMKRASYPSHMKIHEGQKNHLCEQCGRAFLTQGRLNSHQRMQHPPNGPESHLCPDCGKSFPNKRCLQRHSKIHSGVKPFTCQYCGKAFISRFVLTKHERIHTGERPYQCKFCPKSFTQRYTLDMHLEVHKKWKNFQEFVVDDPNEEGKQMLKCDHCPSLFCRLGALLAHRAIHEGATNLVPCSFCSEQFPTARTLRKHAVEKHPESMLECSVCDKLFLTKESLRSHHSVHRAKSKVFSNGTRTYVCDKCHCFYKSFKELQVHERRAHTGEKPFKCTLCDKAFHGAMGLKQHMKTHTDFRPFECNICGKAFRTSQKLQGHVVTHTGERPHVCEYCNKSFTLRTNMVQHQRIHTGRQFVCKFCGKVLPSGVKLRKHEEAHLE